MPVLPILNNYSTQGNATTYFSLHKDAHNVLPESVNMLCYTERELRLQMEFKIM